MFSDMYLFVREERLFCATLGHLLMQRGRNLARFLEILNAKLKAISRISTDGLGDAQIYLEFTFLRDNWNTLRGDNAAKRLRIFELLSRVPSLRHYVSEAFPTGISEFNEFFMGPPGNRIKDDIVYPGQWRVTALHAKFGTEPQVFRDFCKFKWSFNIKPDMVILLPGSQPLCIEAKLESREGWYPTSKGECDIFDTLFGVEKGRVGQIDLQRFMFDVLLGEPCISIIIRRFTEAVLEGVPDAVLTWQDVFGAVDLSLSIGFVQKLLTENRYLNPSLTNF